MSPLLLTFAALTAWQGDQAPAPKSAPPKQPQTQDQAPPEEDDAAKPEDYVFNPVRAKHEERVGDFDMKRGKYHAAAYRYTEATRWNPQFAEAFLKLGEAEEADGDPKLAREAYQKFLDLAPDNKQAAEVRKKLQKLAKG